MCKHLMTGFKFYYEHCVWLCFYNNAFSFYDIFLCHTLYPSLYSGLFAQSEQLRLTIGNNYSIFIMGRQLAVKCDNCPVIG